MLPADAAGALQSDQHGWWRSELMDELHAIYALDQLDMLDDLVRRRNRVADVYRAGLPQLTAQQVRAGDTHCYVHWVARVPRMPGRDALRRGSPSGWTVRYWPCPCPLSSPRKTRSRW